MTRIVRLASFFPALAIAAGLSATPALAAPILVNGGFESGFNGWTRVDALGSDGTFFIQTGTLSPINGFTVPAPPEGAFAAMTDQQAGGSHVLYQDFVVPAVVPSATVSFSVYINNLGPDFFTPATLDWETLVNQRARVDIMSTSEDPFSLNVLLNLFETAPGDPLESGYTTYSQDITAFLPAHLGQTLRLRFTEVDNALPLNMGVDAVDIDVAVPQAPEPATWLLFATGVATLISRRRRS